MYEQKKSDSPLIRSLWHAIVDSDELYTDAASEFWSLGFIKHVDGFLSAELYGPSLRPRVLDGRKGEEYWGVEFDAHVVMSGLNKHTLLGAVVLLKVNNDHFSFGSRSYSIPDYQQLETFIAQLAKDHVVQGDMQVYRSLHGDNRGFSERSRQRRFRDVTGLSKKQIEQLRRARHAFYLLQRGDSPAETALNAGYSDQPHMTRELKLLRGETPAQIIAAHFENA